MYFDINTDFYVSKEDLNEMCIHIAYDNWTIEDTIDNWAYGLDDADFYLVGFIEEDLKKELKKMLDNYDYGVVE